MKHYEAHRFRRRLDSPVPPHPLDPSITPRRAERIRQVLARRTLSLTVIIEECFDPHNATAALRTCEAFGIHAVHVVTGENGFRVNRKVSQGAHRYVDLHRYPTIEEAYEAVRRKGFRIYASSLEGDPVDPHEIAPLSDSVPIALVFGNEERGISERAERLADGSFFIPMCGFTQSLNLSVTIAIALYSLRHRALVEEAPGDMSAEEQRRWYDRWLRRQTERRVAP